VLSAELSHTPHHALGTILLALGTLSMSDNKPAKSSASRFLTNLVIVITILTVLSSLLIFLGFIYVMVVLVSGFMPCIIANLVEKRKRRLASKTITAFNLAGIMPLLFSLARSSDPNFVAQGAFNDPYIWLMVYGFAGFGWLVVQIVPQIVFLFLTIKADFTIRKLQSLQRQLIEEWGEGVKNGG